jgi:UDP-3-O-[3-hydroxymyristoyl] glucosamine N-acyltransferase
MEDVTLGQIAARFGLVLRGDPLARIARVSQLDDASAGSLSFLADPRHRRFLAATAATAVIVDAASEPDCPVNALLADNPRAAYARVAAWLNPQVAITPGVHPSAVVAADAKVAASAEIGALACVGAGAEIGERVLVGPGSVVGPRVQIGADTRLTARVTLYHEVRIGERCLLHGGVVIGADGFGIAQDRDGWVKVPQLGTVVIGNDVEIGANTTVDRGAIGNTVIEDGVKLDNQIQVGHNVRIGAHTAIAGCTGISGSATIGKRCMIGGQVGIAGHLSIADGVVVLGQSMVSSSIDTPGVYAAAVPASEAAGWRRVVARLRQLDALFHRVRRLERRDGKDDPEIT